MRGALTAVGIATIAFFVGLASSIFLLPFWITPFLSAVEKGNPADWVGFAGNFGAGIMTLIAAIIAWFAVQAQIGAQRDIEAQKAAEEEGRRHQRQQEAKTIAIVAITQCVHAASGAMFAVRNAIKAVSVADQQRWDTATTRAIEQVGQTLAHFSLQEISSELSVNDRLSFLMVITQLASVVNIHQRPPEILMREARLHVLRAQLEGIRQYLMIFDSDLDQVFVRDGIDRPMS
jgi:hypothetical protein